jgi:hypothetical protein
MSRRAARQPHRLLWLMSGPALISVVGFVLVAHGLDVGFFHGLSEPQLYALSAAIVALTVMPIVVLVLALMRVRIMRVGGRRYAVPQEWSAEQLRAWRNVGR